jgi:uncharacterized membrane protein
MHRGNREVFAIAVLAVASAAIVLWVPSRPARIVFALPLLFLLPGLSLTASLFPRERLDAPRRLLLSLGLSLSVAILGTLLLDLTDVGLRRSTWAVLLALLICAASAGAVRRRARLVPAGFRWRVPKTFDVAIVLVALAVATGAVVFARTPLTATSVQGYTALSIRSALRPGESRIFRIEISSDELQTTGYHLDVYLGQERLEKWQVKLAPAEQWVRRLRVTRKQIASASWIRAVLYRDKNPYGAYRFVRIRTAAE